MRVATYRNGRIFDGHRLHDTHAIRFEDGKITAFGPDHEIENRGEEIDLDGDILSPGYVDLQVNGGNGVMFNDDPSMGTLRRISDAHRGLGVTRLLPTLITDTREKTRAAIAAAIDAVETGVTGISGLHLEGPHLSIARKGAHDPALIRRMEDVDLEMLVAAAARLPCLKLTIAPENTTRDQVTALRRAGALVSLGHTDADYDTCRSYFDAGARCTTHLFNAMSQIGNREPGLAGATLGYGDVSAGIIADAIHVHPESIRIAWAAKSGPGRIFLVSDAMAVAGTAQTEFQLNGRRIQRSNGRLTLHDGTLAGADLDITTAIRVMVEKVCLPLAAALQAATRTPAQLIGVPIADPNAKSGHASEMIRISKDLRKVTFLEETDRTRA